MASQAKKSGGELVKIEFEKRVAWVSLNRPDKHNAINPALNAHMLQVLDELEGDDRCGIFVLTGEGDSFSAGMDLKEYFRDMEGKPRVATQKARREAYEWMWRRLRYYEKPTIAMVNGWCFGGAFTPVVSCDLAVAAEDAQFGLSEINWGIIPAGNVTRAVAETMRHRDALYYIMTGERFNGRKAAEMGFVNEAVPPSQLRKRTREIADVLLAKDPAVLKAAKDAFKRTRDLPWETSEDYLTAKQEQLWLIGGHARQEGLRQFLDEKSFRPGLEPFKRNPGKK